MDGRGGDMRRIIDPFLGEYRRCEVRDSQIANLICGRADLDVRRVEFGKERLHVIRR